MKTKGAVFSDNSLNPSVEEIELTGPKAGKVLVRIVPTGVCHTDIKTAESNRSPRPFVLGHEGSGVVEATGARVTRVAEGAHLVMSFGSCGRCLSCLDAEPAYCHNADDFGCTRPNGEFYLSADGAPVHGDFSNQSSFASHGIVKVDKNAPRDPGAAEVRRSDRRRRHPQRFQG